MNGWMDGRSLQKQKQLFADPPSVFAMLDDDSMTGAALPRGTPGASGGSLPEAYYRATDGSRPRLSPTRGGWTRFESTPISTLPAPEGEGAERSIESGGCRLVCVRACVCMCVQHPPSLPPCARAASN